MANYVSISHREMQDFMEALGFRELTVEERSGRYATGKLRVVRERVFERKLGEGVIRVYSSVVGPDSRRKGRDAIRVQYWVDGVKVYGTQRVHRVVNWRRNLLQRIYELDDLVAKGGLRKVPRDSAGQPMVVRTAKQTGKKFWGSSNYPRNRETRRFWGESFHSEVDESVGNQCPYCGDDDIMYVDNFEDGYITVGCNVCGSQWFEVWKFMGIELENGREGWEAEDMTNEEDAGLVLAYENNWFSLVARTPTGQDYTMYPLDSYSRRHASPKIKGVEQLVEEIAFIFDNLGDAPNPYAIDIFTTEDGRKELIGVIKYGKVEPSGKFWPTRLSKLLNRRLDFVRSAENIEDDFIWDEEAGLFFDYMVVPQDTPFSLLVYRIMDEDLDPVGKGQIRLRNNNLRIDSIFIEPSYQRKGIATSFVNHVGDYWDIDSDNLTFSDAVSDGGEAFIDSFAAAGKYPANDVRSWLKKGQTVWWIDPDEPQNRINWKISESWEDDYGDAIPEDDEIIWIYTDAGSEAEVPLHEVRLRRHIPSYAGQTCNFCGRNKMDLKAVGDKLIRTKRPTSWDIEEDEPMSIGSVLSCQECEQTIDDFDWANHAMYNLKWWD
tara:strand:+ start:714 stop:2528 length:1815 start_codon:yes stop_codon:yes gene_type:complete